MNGPGFARGVMVALGLAFMSSVAVTVLAGLMPFQDLIRLLVPGLSLAYLISISRYRYRRSGWASCLLLWSGFSLCLWLVTPWVSEYLLLHVVALSLLRTVFFHKNLLAGLLDMALSLFGLAAAYWALSHTSSVFLSTWCFFLSQAAFVLIPGRGDHAMSPADPKHHANQFDQARHKAEEALRQLASR